ncbi:MAG: hypothetical protein S4CHLAM102_02130 [Chlamydiia bacterium]|nr:hypothetical protein [Chlamydiia bacterium]
MKKNKCKVAVPNTPPEKVLPAFVEAVKKKHNVDELVLEVGETALHEAELFLDQYIPKGEQKIVLKIENEVFSILYRLACKWIEEEEAK